MTSRAQSKRQQDKQRSQLFKDLYFLIKWLDTDDTLYDTIPFRDITAPEGLDVLSLLPGETCQASFANQLYDAEVVAVGKYAEMKKVQAQKERDVDDVEIRVSDSIEHDSVTVDKNGDSPTKVREDKTSVIDKESQSMEENRKMKEYSPTKKQRNLTKEKESETKESRAKEKKSETKESGTKEKSGMKKNKCGTKKESGTNDNASGVESNENEKGSRTKGKSSGMKEKERGMKKKSGMKTGRKEEIRVKDSQTKENKEESITKTLKSPRKRLLSSCVSSDESSDKSDEDFLEPTKKARLELSPKKKRRDRPWHPTFHDTSESEGEISGLQSSSLEARRTQNMAENELFKKMIGLSPGIPSTTLTAEVTQLKEKMRVLQKAHVTLKRKVSAQETEINYLRRVTSPEMSSASEATPDHSFTFLAPQGPSHARFKERSPIVSPSSLKTEHVPEFLKGVDTLRLANAKLQSDPGTAALKLMDCVFTTSEMVNGNPSGISKSKDPSRKRTIRALDTEKMKYIDDILQEKWPGKSTVDKDIRKRMTQKCTDYYSDSRYKHLRLT